MKATILNGALPGDTFVDAAGIALQDALQAEGWTVTPWTLRDEKSAYCLGCFECWTKTPGLCRIDDAGRDVAASVIGSDLAIYLTPITFGGYSSELKKAVDRIICLISPFFSASTARCTTAPATPVTRICWASVCCPRRTRPRSRSSTR